MRTPMKFALAGVLCVAGAGGVVAAIWIASGESPYGSSARKARPPASAPLATKAAVPEKPPEPPRPIGTFIDVNPLDDGGIGFAQQFTGSIRDPKSLAQLREAVDVRGRLALNVLESELDQLHLGTQTPRDGVAYGVKLTRSIGLLYMYEGKFDLAAVSFERAEALARSAGMSWKDRTDLIALRGIVSLRRGEVANCIECVGPSSCIFPIVKEGAHTVPEGSRKAIAFFSRYLEEVPGDLRVRWLLNLAYMTLGEYPEKVPPEFLIPLDRFQSNRDLGRFENVASPAGLTLRGPNMAGGSIFDDFNGDGLPDLFTTSLDATRGPSVFLNKGDGTFEDHSSAAGVADQVFVLNLTRTDFDNDGDLDLLLLRGAWDIPMRLSLLRNKGDATFEDVTISAGLADPISTESAAWGDYDNDGFLDLFVCGEFVPPTGPGPGFVPKPANRCRLYHNNGDGTFKDVAAEAGVLNEHCAKGSAWGDYDGDGKLDLFVSNMDGPSRLYHNEGSGKFVDRAAELHATADRGFACWFWDYDNDGKLDLFVNFKGISLAEEVAIATGAESEKPVHPRLYRNLGPEGFREVAKEVGLDRGLTPMGCNFGDIDNDGYLDIYEGTGEMSFSGLVPNRMFANVGGTKFEDVTMSTGTGHLQKGHGVSFADFNADGQLDLFVEAGGAVPGDNAYNVLFKNPGHKAHWLQVKLVGTKTNRAAIGTKIRAAVKGKDGLRSIYRTIGNNSSFGGNTLVESIGLGDADRIEELEITWPAGSKQTFREVAADRFVKITEGSDTIEAGAAPGR